MSVSLKKLRGIFGDDLVVHRGNGDTRFTELALALRPRVRQLIQASREVFDFTPDFEPARDERTISIVVPDVVELLILGPLLARICNEAPLMRVLSLPFGYQPVTTLFERPLDVAIVGEAFASPEFAKERLFSETMSCMVWSDGRYAQGISESDFLRGRHVGISQPNERLVHPVGQTLHRLSEGLEIVARASSYAALPHAIVGTDLIATTLTSYARLCATMLPIVVLPTPVEIPNMVFVAQWQSYRAKEPMMCWLMEQLRAVVAHRTEG
jgi:DNA-binding transcriptional LysR family regulator